MASSEQPNEPKQTPVRLRPMLPDCSFQAVEESIWSGDLVLANHKEEAEEKAWYFALRLMHSGPGLGFCGAHHLGLVFVVVRIGKAKPKGCR